MPDHWQQMQLVKISVEQASDDRIEPPAMIVDAHCDIGDGNGRSSASDEVKSMGGGRHGYAAAPVEHQKVLLHTVREDHAAIVHP